MLGPDSYPYYQLPDVMPLSAKQLYACAEFAGIDIKIGLLGRWRLRKFKHKPTNQTNGTLLVYILSERPEIFWNLIEAWEKQGNTSEYLGGYQTHYPTLHDLLTRVSYHNNGSLPQSLAKRDFRAGLILGLSEEKSRAAALSLKYTWLDIPFLVMLISHLDPTFKSIELALPQWERLVTNETAYVISEEEELGIVASDYEYFHPKTIRTLESEFESRGADKDAVIAWQLVRMNFPEVSVDDVLNLAAAEVSIDDFYRYYGAGVQPSEVPSMASMDIDPQLAWAVSGGKPPANFEQRISVGVIKSEAEIEREYLDVLEQAMRGISPRTHPKNHP